MTATVAVRPRRRRPGPFVWTLVAVVVLALAASGWVAWQVWGTDSVARGRASEQVAALRSSWDDVPATPAEAPVGEAFAVITIPRLGVEWPVVAGVDQEHLRRGVGWYRSTAWPGDTGNAALAGLRVTHGAPFRDLATLQAGDEVLVETASGRLVYEVVVPAHQVTVEADQDWVLDPVPGHPGIPPWQPVLTLTTAQDLVATGERSVAFATLVSRSER